ncbi:MAG: iron-sulfur cluster insertion protein ErpA [Alphaproteobacteria bacterium]
MLSITDKAAKRIKFLIEQENNPNIALRISVDGGGCSGFQYNYDFKDDYNSQEDEKFEKDGAVIVIDKFSLENFMQNVEIDFVDELKGKRFEIRNPNASAKCGCGNSFAV